jgi:hypothetical protein
MVGLRAIEKRGRNEGRGEKGGKRGRGGRYCRTNLCYL